MKMLKKTKYAIMMATICVLASPTFAFALQGLETATTAIQDTAKTFAGPIVGILLVVLGVTFLVGTQQQKEQAKSGIAIKVVGLALIALAASFAPTILAWFGL